MLIEIDDRLYNDFVQWASVNQMTDEDMNKYITKAFRDRFMTDKYGDLNDKIKKEEPVKAIEPKVIVSDIVSQDEPIIESINEPINSDNEEPVIEKPKRGSPKKKIIQSK